MAGLWGDLARVLARLESIAAQTRTSSDEDVLESLSVLQYALHTAGELAIGIDPPIDAEWAHHELAAALADARDATAEIAEAAGATALRRQRPLVPEWRGALFRCGSAQMRVATGTASPPPRPEAELRPRSTALARRHVARPARDVRRHLRRRGRGLAAMGGRPRARRRRILRLPPVTNGLGRRYATRWHTRLAPSGPRSQALRLESLPSAHTAVQASSPARVPAAP